MYIVQTILVAVGCVISVAILRTIDRRLNSNREMIFENRKENRMLLAESEKLKETMKQFDDDGK